MTNKIVLRYMDGTIARGRTYDFFPGKPWFHFQDHATGRVRRTDVSMLKGVFFVKSYEGIPEYGERYEIGRIGLGTRVRVRFKDGEWVMGYTTGVSAWEEGFFLFPSDPHCNNERIFVVKEATEEIILGSH